MSEDIKVLLPKLGESILSATIVQWFKKIGDPVGLDEPLLEVSTDKVNSEIPSPAAGVLMKIVASSDQELQVGEVLAILSASALARVPSAPLVVPPADTPSDLQDFLSPSVMRLLKEKGIALVDIERIPRTGQGGRLTKQDVERYQACPLDAKRAVVPSGTERVKMSGMRRAIADNLVRSFHEAPHASIITEVDVTRVVCFIQEQKHIFHREHGVKLTITAFAARAIARSLQSFPLINSSLEGDEIVMKRSIHLGVAVSVDQGVLVPVVQNCQSLNLVEIACQISELAFKARSHRLQLVDMQSGTMTMTNFGMTGALIGIPIIRFPEVAIVGLGAIIKKVVAMPDDSIAIRSMMMVSLTFDHRVLDGIYGCGFLNTLKKHLEEDVSL